MKSFINLIIYKSWLFFTIDRRFYGARSHDFSMDVTIQFVIPEESQQSN
ncbi:hypothetical protein [Chryseobacterium polytrichastri]|nr:hypothetical protein [Chryseobacterium polytrichastri]